MLQPSNWYVEEVMLPAPVALLSRKLENTLGRTKEEQVVDVTSAMRPREYSAATIVLIVPA